MTVLYCIAAPAAVRYGFMPDLDITIEKDDEGCTRLGLVINGEKQDEYLFYVRSSSPSDADIRQTSLRRRNP